MTIGIAAFGPGAGQAVFRALHVAEAAGTGSIGGFAAYAVLDAEGRLWRADTQRGGTATLFIDGETTGGPPPAHIAAAPYAAVISSGPDRPAPLSMFLAAEPGIGLVTGHRLPNTPGPDGRALNQSVLAAMRAGRTALEALHDVLDPLPAADAGMIALGPGAGMAALNSALVAARPDVGSARRVAPDGAAAVEVLHNAIHPVGSLAGLVADVAFEAMYPPRPEIGEIVVRAGCPVVSCAEHRVLVDGNLVAHRIETPLAPTGHDPQNCAAIYLGSAVIGPGGVLGYTFVEPNAMVAEGKIVTLSGQSEFRIPFAGAE